jgi:hypothetical protein
MWFYVLFFLAASLLILGLLRCLWLHAADGSVVDRVAFWCLPGASVSAVALVGGCLGSMLFSPFSYIHLAPSMSLWYGYDLYYGPTDGPVLNAIYPPLAALVYLPCGLGRDPTSVACIGFTVNVVLLMTPIACFLVRLSTGRRGVWTRLAWAFVFFVAASVCYRPSRSLLEVAHADAPALAFGTLACFFFWRAAQNNRLAPVFLSSAFAVMAVWSKQTAVPILAALPALALLTSGRRFLLRYLSCLVLGGLAISGFFVLCFGFERMLFNIWTLQRRLPLQVAGVGWLGVFWQLAAVAAPLLCLIVLAVFVDVQAGGDRQRPVRRWLRESPWTVLLFVGMCMLPVSVLSRARLGGDDNSYHSVYYFILAATVLLAELAVRRSDRRTQEMSVVMMMLCWLLHSIFAVPTARQMDLLSSARANPEQLAYQYAVRHPGEAFFPRFTLASLMAEGKLYHCEIAVLDHKNAGFPLSERHFREYLPAGLRYVVFGPDLTEERPWILKYLEEYVQRTSLGELPGWVAYERRGSRPE